MPSILTATTQGLSSPQCLLSPLDDWHPSVCSKAALFRAPSYAVPSGNFTQGAEHSRQRALQALLLAQALFSLQLCQAPRSLSSQAMFSAGQKGTRFDSHPQEKGGCVGQTRSPHPLQRALQVPLPLRPHSSARQREPCAAAMGECGAGEGSLQGAGRGSEHCPRWGPGASVRAEGRTPLHPSVPALLVTPAESCFGARNVFLRELGSVGCRCCAPPDPASCVALGTGKGQAAHPLGRGAEAFGSPSGTERSVRCVFLRLTCECWSRGVSHLTSQRFYIFSLF